MSITAEGLTEEIYAGVEKRYSEYSDEYIAQELLETSRPIDTILRNHLSPPFMRFFARVEHALEDEAFVAMVQKFAYYHPTSTVPYSSLQLEPVTVGKVMVPQKNSSRLEMDQFERSYAQALREHDDAIPGRHMHPKAIRARAPSVGHLGSYAARALAQGDHLLPPDLSALYEEAARSQHYNGYCSLGHVAWQLLLDKYGKASNAIAQHEQRLLSVCLTYQYPAFRMASTGGSLFSLTDDVTMPIVDIKDMQELSDAKRYTQATAALIYLIEHDSVFRQDVETMLTHPEARKAVSATQRARDKGVSPEGYTDAVLRIGAEGLGAAVLPGLSELRRPQEGAERISYEEIIAQRMMNKLTILSPLGYMGKVNLQGRGLRIPLLEQHEDRWHFSQEAKICLDVMRKYMRRQIHFRRMRNYQIGMQSESLASVYLKEPAQRGDKCPFVLPSDNSLSAGVVLGATELIYLIASKLPVQPWTQGRESLLHLARQSLSAFQEYIPHEGPDLAKALEDANQTLTSPLTYQGRGRSVARRVLQQT